MDLSKIMKMNKQQIAQFKKTLAGKEWRPIMVGGRGYSILEEACADTVGQRKAMWFYEFFNPLFEHMRDLYQNAGIYRTSHYVRDHVANPESVKEALERRVEEVQKNYGKPIDSLTDEEWKHGVHGRYWGLPIDVRGKPLEQSVEEITQHNLNYFLTDKTILLFDRLKRKHIKSFEVDTVYEVVREELSPGKLDKMNFLPRGERPISTDSKELRQLLETQRKFTKRNIRPSWRRDELEGASGHDRYFMETMLYAPVAYINHNEAYAFLKKFLKLSVREGRNIFVDIAPRK